MSTTNFYYISGTCISMDIMLSGLEISYKSVIVICNFCKNYCKHFRNFNCANKAALTAVVSGLSLCNQMLLYLGLVYISSLDRHWWAYP